MARTRRKLRWAGPVIGSLLMLATAACTAYFSRSEIGSRPVAPNVLVPAVNVSSPDSDRSATLTAVLPGTWQRTGFEIYNTFTTDGRYLVDNQDAGLSLPDEATYQVIDNDRVRFTLADGSSVILDVSAPDHNTLILRYPETAYAPAQEMRFERVDGVPEMDEAVDAALNLLYYDDFSDPSSGWPTGRTAEHAYGYTNGGYAIGILRPSLLYHVRVPDLQAGNVSIEVDATRTSGEESEMSAVVLCRVMRDPVRFYMFEVTPDGYFTISKFVDGRAFPIGIGFERSRAIRQGDATNHIRADCIDDTLTLYVNGTRLAILQDGELRRGGVALGASTFGDFDGASAEVIFDNLLITER